MIEEDSMRKLVCASLLLIGLVRVAAAAEGEFRCPSTITARPIWPKTVEATLGKEHEQHPPSPRVTMAFKGERGDSRDGRDHRFAVHLANDGIWLNGDRIECGYRSGDNHVFYEWKVRSDWDVASCKRIGKPMSDYDGLGYRCTI